MPTSFRLRVATATRLHQSPDRTTHPGVFQYPPFACITLKPFCDNELWLIFST
ncbi:hypothetical protein ETAA8_04140 [Anatilimnocola aggregata]|uniref:Uncharacterized protein n=1 Tax=Anatilimnocola aggregata TaxID=2528021 RepID=A0A517Y531_9BACT|nr:hypothetical protein ETAA8_04140 [Anatilimnocola aggregata]